VAKKESDNSFYKGPL